MFIDCNIPLTSFKNASKKTTPLLNELMKLKYDGAVLNYVVESRSISPADKCQIEIIEVSKTFLQKTRLTVQLNDLENVAALLSNSGVTKSYDLIAVIPTSDKTFQSACSQLNDIDIICIDGNQKLPFYLNKGLIENAISRGIFFEITYSSALHNAACRKNFLLNGNSLIRLTRGKNIILSSAAKDKFDIRGPYDVVYLSHLLGLKKELSFKAVSSNCLLALKKGESRNAYKDSITVEKTALKIENEEGEDHDM